MRSLLFLGTTVMLMSVAFVPFDQASAAPPHNVVLFVADGLRFRMVDDRPAPTLAAIARDGVTSVSGVISVVRNTQRVFTPMQSSLSAN